MAKKKSRLGRGLRSLIDTPVAVEPQASDNTGSSSEADAMVPVAVAELDDPESSVSEAVDPTPQADDQARPSAADSEPEIRVDDPTTVGGDDGVSASEPVSAEAPEVAEVTPSAKGPGGFWSRVAIGAGEERPAAPESKLAETAPADVAPAPDVPDEGGETHAGLTWVEIERVRASAWQPRETFDDARLGELAESIRRSGLIQPIVVRPSADGYELVAGERRVRAAAMAGLARVPAVVRDLSDEDAAEWGLTENIQREDLNPVERARAMRRLMEAFGLTQAEVAERVGLERSTVTNHLRLLELDDEVLGLLAEGTLGMGHGRALAGLARVSLRRDLAHRAVREGWSVRRLERAVAEPEKARSEAMEPDMTARQAAARDWEKKLSEALGTKVGVRTDKSGKKGKVVVEFYTLEHFEDLMRRMGAG